MIYLIGGTRPNFIKIAALSRAFEKINLEYEIIHTGQHYDYYMNRIFFEEFNLKTPITHLGVGSGTHAQQTGCIMIKLEEYCIENRPDLMFVVGDVNSTMAAALVASKLHIPIAHQEAGMRSKDKKMPEEINRIVTDSVSDYLFPISPIDSANLLNEGIPQSKIFLVGDPMIDNLLHYIKEKNQDEDYILVELHRPANVDNKENLENILKALKILSKQIKIIFSIHPRTRKMIKEFNLWYYLDIIDHRNPMGYFEFIETMNNAKIVITDSDGIQQETSILNIPCVSIRDTTNIPYTIEFGTNTLKSPKTDQIVKFINHLLDSNQDFKNSFPEKYQKLNDGKSCERIASIVEQIIKGKSNG